MHPSERQNEKERRKRMRDQRKQYLREEKQSLRRQRREMKEMRRGHRKSSGAGWWYLFGWLPRLFGINRVEPEGGSAGVPDFLQEFRELRRERRNLRQKTAQMRKRIRKDRIEGFKKSFIGFLKRPVKIRKLKPEEKALRNAIKEDMKRERRERFYHIPQMVSSSVEISMKRRRDRIRFFFYYLRHTFSGFTIIKNDRRLKSELIISLLNSTALFVLGFMIAYFANQLVTVVIASIYDIPAVLYSYRIFWPLYTYSSLYTRQALIVIFAAGPFLSVAMAILSYRIFLWVRHLGTNFKLLALWVLFHSVNLFFGAYIAGVITRTGFVYTTEWIFYSQVFGVEEIVFLISSLVALIVAGYLITRQFLLAAGSAALLEPKIRIFYMFAQVLIPWLAGLVIIVLVNYPRNPPELIILYTATVLMVVPMFFNFNAPGNQMLKVELRRTRMRFAWIYFILFFASLLLIRMVVYRGLNFY